MAITSAIVARIVIANLILIVTTMIATTIAMVIVNLIVHVRKPPFLTLVRLLFVLLGGTGMRNVQVSSLPVTSSSGKNDVCVLNGSGNTWR